MLPSLTMSLLTLHTADVLLTMEGAPLYDAGVVVDEDGRIVEIGSAREMRVLHERRRDHQILMPGVLNCHIHLTDAAREVPVPGGQGLIQWVRGLLSGRGGEVAPEDRERAIRGRLEEMRAGGTVAIGEVVNDGGTLGPIADSGMRCRLIHELIAFRAEAAEKVIAAARQEADTRQLPETISATIGAHAPYSVSPELMKLIAAENAHRGTFLYQHLAEDPDERDLYEHGGGAWREFLKGLGAWDERWQGVGMSPIAYYDSLGLLNDRFVAVHLADATADEIDLLARRGTMAILSPFSNLHITGKLPLFESIIRSGMRFALGTDGRGSNPGSDVFGEARILLEYWPDLKPGALLDALTRSGAGILQFGELGVIRPGSRPGLLAVELDNVPHDFGALERAIILDAGSRQLVA